MNQQRLIDYLVVETELALMFARMAVDRGLRGDNTRCERSVQRARVELDIIRRFEGRVEDDGARRRILERAGEVGLLIATLREQPAAIASR